MKHLRVYLLRHGEPENTRIFYGHTDVGLSDRGRQQIAAQVEALADAKLDAVYTSDLSRARLGAEAIAAGHGLPVRVDDDLREMHLGQLENVAWADAMQRFGGLAKRSYRDMLDYAFEGGGESVRDVSVRILPKLAEAIVEHAAAGSAGIVVYAHNTVVRIILAQVAGAGAAGYARFEQRYGAINRVDVERSRVANDPWSASSIAYCNLDPMVASRHANL